jgi:Peptidase family M48
VSEDLEVEPGVTVGDWLMREFTAHYYLETEPWATKRAARVVARLDPHRRSGRGGRALEVVIPWITAPLAFTAPGRFIFFGRRLYERCPDDETTAFVVGHEMAHHDLGHMDLIPDWMPRFAHAKGGRLAVVAMAAVERRLYGPDRECLADEYALDLCIRAGCDSHRCLAFFQIMENYALDMGDQGMVFGPDEESDAELEPDAPWLTKARIWAWQRTYGYLPLRDRPARLEHYLRNRGVSERATA